MQETPHFSIVEPGEDEPQIQDGKNHRRIGIADCMCVAWVQVCVDFMEDAEREEWEKRASDPGKWFIQWHEGQVYEIHAFKVDEDCLVWMSQKGEENDKGAHAQADKAELFGTMTYARFESHFLLPLASRLGKTARATSGDHGGASLPGFLNIVRGRVPCLVLDGASYHKKQSLSFVAREGQGSLFGPGGRGREDPNVGWMTQRCVAWLYLTNLGYAGSYDKQKAHCSDAEFGHVEHLEATGVLELRQRIDEEAGRIKFRLTEICRQEGVQVQWTTPYGAKGENPIEQLWGHAKREYYATPLSIRNTDKKAIATLREILIQLGHRSELLRNICLPVCRSAYSVLCATYLKKDVMYKGKHVLPREVREACVQVGEKLRRGEALDDPLLGRSDISKAPGRLTEVHFPMKLHDSKSAEKALVVDIVPLETVSVGAKAEGTNFSPGAELPTDCPNVEASMELQRVVEERDELQRQCSQALGTLDEQDKAIDRAKRELAKQSAREVSREVIQLLAPDTWKCKSCKNANPLHRRHCLRCQQAKQAA